MKKEISGVVNNISTNPFQTFSKKRTRDSTFLTFDINFDLCDEDGKMTRIWFNRSFLPPPPLEDGDEVVATGTFGRFWGAWRRHNFYAERIIDKSRNKVYTPWRNIDISEKDVEGPKQPGTDSPRE